MKARTSVCLGAAALLFALGCSGDGGSSARAKASSATTGKGITLTMPSQLLGLQVKSEPIAEEVQKVRQLYLDSIGLFSFRESDDLLRATLQVSRFNELAEPDDPRFRSSIISNLGSTVPQELRVGDNRVWLTSGNQQVIFVWFQERGFLVLSVRSDYPFARTMLRRLLEADLNL